jgi:hypothetical protein
MAETKNTNIRLLCVDKEIARLAVLTLLEMSAWFELEPYPDNVYFVTVKPEAASRLSAVLGIKEPLEKPIE